jgi:acyl carrier protein
VVVIGERPKGHPATDQTVRRAIRRAVDAAVGLVPAAIRLVEEGWLVKSTSGKISRRENLAKHLAERSTLAVARADGVRARVCAVVAETFRVSPTEVTPEVAAGELDGWDSLGHATLILRLERAFDVAIPGAAASAARTVVQLQALVERLHAEGASPAPTGTVITGTDGRTLFHRDHDAVEQVTGARRFSEAELALWARCIAERHRWCAATGAAYVHLIVPEKHVVCADLLPPSIVPSDLRPVTQFLAVVPEGLREYVLYPLEELQAPRPTRETYLTDDTHWNMYGGFLGYQALMRAIPPSVPIAPLTAQDVRFVEQPFLGDLGARLQAPPSSSAPMFEHRTPYPLKRVYSNERFGRGDVAVYETPDQSKPRAVLFRDSFANFLVPHLIPAFARLTVVSSVHVHYDLLEAERPDVVFFQIAERFLAHRDGGTGAAELPLDHAAPRFDEYAGISAAALAAVRGPWGD